jgi:hypothetical protein
LTEPLTIGARQVDLVIQFFFQGPATLRGAAGVVSVGGALLVPQLFGASVNSALLPGAGGLVGRLA